MVRESLFSETPFIPNPLRRRRRIADAIHNRDGYRIVNAAGRPSRPSPATPCDTFPPY